MEESTTYVGLDAHKVSIQVAMLMPGGELMEWQVANEAAAVKRMARKITQKATGDVVCCYEAGPCGYTLKRQMEKIGLTCQVVAPSLIPKKPGDRVKTDRRDAVKLAELLRAGLLTEVHPPSPEQEAVRDLCRGREDAKEDLARCRHRLSKMLLRRGWTWTAGKNAWTQAHRQWLKGLRFEYEADRTVFADYLLAIEQLEERLKTLEEKLGTQAQQDPYREPVGWLRCFRGIDTVTALTIVAELHDFSRFHSPRELMGYLGLVPSEHTSSDSVRRGSITKAGNCHVRRVLVETAWHYRHPASVGAALRARRKGQPGAIIAIADKAQQRLHRRYWRLSHRGKLHAKVVVAIARELAGFIWAALYGHAQGRAQLLPGL